MGVMLSRGWNPLLAKNGDMPEESDWELFCVNSARGSYWTQSSWR